MSVFEKSKFATAHASFEPLVTVVGTSVRMDTLGFDYIINDGPGDVMFNINAPVGDTGTFTKKAGERDEDWPRRCGTLYMQAVSVDTRVRVRGLRE